MTLPDGVISYLISIAANETSRLARVLWRGVRRTDIDLGTFWPVLAVALFFWAFAASTVDATLRPHVYHVDGHNMRVLAGGMVLIATVFSSALLQMFLTFRPSGKKPTP